MVEFKEWPKIPRGGRGKLITITEKIDGTNACVIVENGVVVGSQSRNQLLGHNHITGEYEVYNDNYGFAQWVKQHKYKLAGLGDGYHYGEWVGPGIQSNPHNLKKKTFFLFNSDRWRDGRQQRPEGVECVPVLYEGPNDLNDDWIDKIESTMEELEQSAREKGYTPEGVIVWYHKFRRYEKYTFKNPEGKWKNE